MRAEPSPLSRLRRLERSTINVATFVATLFDRQLPFRVEAYDGSVAEPTVVSPANSVTLRILSRDGIARVLTHPGESDSRAPTSPGTLTSTATLNRSSNSTCRR